ncbi:hypothetical protein MNBD_NITROSPINAE04-963 [hydrothermal vent metagenome]|uniref:Uncharacterized protein n=1 Tax=hydrothermal vent metagenome TaxID=652676 RepID=A0A3B1C158_9ZZZZ
MFAEREPERRNICLTKMAKKFGVILDDDEIWFGDDRRKSERRIAGPRIKTPEKKKKKDVKVGSPTDFFG